MAGVIWLRADHGVLPEVDSEITAVVYPIDTSASVIVYRRQLVVAAKPGRTGAVIMGPSLPASDDFEMPPLPGRPDDIVGRRAIFWKPYEGGPT